MPKKKAVKMSLLDFAGPASTAGALPTGPRESQGDDDGRSFGQGGGFENHSCGAAAALCDCN